MSSPSSSTRPQQPVQAAAPARSSVNPLTLLIAAVASAAAAYITSKIWQSGTLIATAMTPVIVALVKEALERPAAKVTTIGAQITPVRTRASAGSPSSTTGPRGAQDPTVVQTPDLDPTHAPMTVHRTGGRVNRRWVRVGLVTGLLAFVIAAVVYTVPELIAGQSAAGGARATSIFGGTSRDRSSRTPSTTTTSTSTTETTDGATTETTPQEQTTATVTEETVPTVTVTTPAPAQTTETAPQQTTTTTAPDATATTPDSAGSASATP